MSVFVYSNKITEMGKLNIGHEGHVLLCGRGKNIAKCLMCKMWPCQKKAI